MARKINASRLKTNEEQTVPAIAQCGGERDSSRVK